MSQIYLDYNATTPIAEQVVDSMLPFLRKHYGNPSSSHSLGKICKEAIEQARSSVAALIGAQADEIYFTSGGTESNNLTIKGIFFREENRNAHFITSCFEHPAVKEPALFHGASGGTVSWLPTSRDGVIDLAEFESAINEGTRLVSIMHANNEIGTIQPIPQVSRICREKNIPLHSDAAQSIGKIPIDVEEMGVDFLTIAGHKLYAPKGIGALYIRTGCQLHPSVHGAGHERGVRPGTENVPYIVGLGVAAKLAMENQAEQQRRALELRNRLESILVSSIPGLVINGASTARLPNTSSLCFPGVVAAEMLTLLPELCVSTGAACHSDAIALSDTLQAIGLSNEQGVGTIRVSCGRHTSQEEVDSAAAQLRMAWEKSIGR